MCMCLCLFVHVCVCVCVSVCVSVCLLPVCHEMTGVVPGYQTHHAISSTPYLCSDDHSSPLQCRYLSPLCMEESRSRLSYSLGERSLLIYILHVHISLLEYALFQDHPPTSQLDWPVHAYSPRPANHKSAVEA